MARSIGPILAVGGITIINKTVVNGEPMDWRIPIMTGFAAAGFALLERVWEDGAVALAYMSLVAILLTRVNPKEPSPVENLLKWTGL